MSTFDPASIDRKKYRRDGFLILKGFFSESEIASWERSVVSRFAFQALRIGAIRERLLKGSQPSAYKTAEDLDQIVTLFEELDTQAGFIANQLLADSLAARRLWANSSLTPLASLILNCPEDQLVLPPTYPTLFISLPTNIRLRYTWHAEMNCCFPKRRNFVNFWFPSFRAKTSENGTMFLKRGSYVKNLTYINAKMPGSPLKQFYLPDYEHDEFEEVPMICGPGDLVVFEGNMIHRSSENTSALPTYQTVMRAFDYSKDMTLSRAETAGYGQEDYGRFDLQYVKY